MNETSNNYNERRTWDIFSKFLGHSSRNKDDDNGNKDDDGGGNNLELEVDESFLLNIKHQLLGKAESFDLPNCPERGFRATSFKFCSFSRPYTRAMHASWICFFASYSVQFAMAPLLPQLEVSLNLSQQDIWLVSVLRIRHFFTGGAFLHFILTYYVCVVE
jgi:hypothetical protein